MPQNWFEDPEIVAQFPWLYRQYARYCRFMSNPNSPRIVGGTRVFQLVSRTHTSLGFDHKCGIRWQSGKIFLDLTDNRIFTVLEEVLAESPERKIFNALVKPGCTFVDVGANHGSYGLIASRLVGPNGFVLAFEPQHRLAELIVASLESLETCPFKVVQQICTDRQAEMEFFVPADASGSAGVFADFSAKGHHQKSKLPTTTLDSCFLDLPRPKSLFLKIDVEGCEFSVINGGRTTIQAFRPPILFEINPESALASGHSISELLQLLSELGYARFCEIDEFPESKEVHAVNTATQRNILALHGTN